MSLPKGLTRAGAGARERAGPCLWEQMREERSGYVCLGRREQGGRCPPSRSSTLLCWLSCHETTIWESLLSADGPSTSFPQSPWEQGSFLITGFEKLFWFLDATKTGPDGRGSRADTVKEVKPGLGNNNQLTRTTCYPGSNGSVWQG